MSNEQSKIDDIRREVRSAYDSDFWHTWPENIQAFYRDLNTLLAHIEALEAVADAAGAVSAAIHDERIDRYGREIIYVKMGTTEYGLDRESTNKMAMALFALRDALKAVGE